MTSKSEFDDTARRGMRNLTARRSWREWAFIAGALVLKAGIIVAIFR